MTNQKPDLAKTAVGPSDYIRANFEPNDRIAILVRNSKRGETIQRISTAEKIAAALFQNWMRYKNERDGCDIYIGMNALKVNAFTRTKHDVQTVRHLYADFDHHGSASLAAIEKSHLVPTPNYVLNTSPDKYQVIWQVEEIDVAQAEELLHALAREFAGDHAATDAARVLRVPGFLNKKYEQDFLVTARLQSHRVHNPRDFRLEVEIPDSGYRQPRPLSRATNPTEPRHISQSERDWAYVKNALARGADPEELIADLAKFRASDKSDPQYYARLTVTKALADLQTQPSTSKNYSDPSAHAGREVRE